jgi:hypothetical protein
MKITRSHLNFWNTAQHPPKPSWAKQLKEPFVPRSLRRARGEYDFDNRALIHTLINQQPISENRYGGRYYKPDIHLEGRGKYALEWHNTLNFFFLPTVLAPTQLGVLQYLLDSPHASEDHRVILKRLKKRYERRGKC